MEKFEQSSEVKSSFESTISKIEEIQKTISPLEDKAKEGFRKKELTLTEKERTAVKKIRTVFYAINLSRDGVPLDNFEQYFPTINGEPSKDVVHQSMQDSFLVEDIKIYGNAIKMYIEREERDKESWFVEKTNELLNRIDMEEITQDLKQS